MAATATRQLRFLRMGAGAKEGPEAGLEVGLGVELSLWCQELDGKGA